MKLVGLFSLKSGALLHFARGTLRVHESWATGAARPHQLLAIPSRAAKQQEWNSLRRQQ